MREPAESIKKSTSMIVLLLAAAALENEGVHRGPKLPVLERAVLEGAVRARDNRNVRWI